MRYLLLSGCILLAGCQSFESSIPTPETLGAATNNLYAGMPVEKVLARYGMPEYQFMDGDIRVLVWNTQATLRQYEPVTTTTTGQIGGSQLAPWANAIPYRESTTTRQGYDATYACLMQVGVKPDGLVDSVRFGGKMGACQNFMP
jgi:hypothetical protein